MIPLGAEVGWEAAVFDHHQAFVSALVSKLSVGKRRSEAADHTSGSTYHYDLWRGHPMESEITGWLQAMRKGGSELRQRLEEHNGQHPAPRQAERIRVTVYAGQNVIEEGGDEE